MKPHTTNRILALGLSLCLLFGSLGTLLTAVAEEALPEEVAAGAEMVTPADQEPQAEAPPAQEETPQEEAPAPVVVPAQPETPAEPEVPEQPETPAEPEVPAQPETPAEPEVPEQPETPEEPEVPEQPQTPEEPEVPEQPETPAEPEVPEQPETPAEPEVPAQPETPEEPEVPEQPETPEEPELPELPSQDAQETPDATTEADFSETLPAKSLAPGNNPVIKETWPGSTTIYLRWDSPADAERFAVSIKDSAPGASWRVLTTTLTDDSYIITGLNKKTNCTVLVQAWVNNQWSSASAPESQMMFTTGDFDMIPNRPYIIELKPYRTSVRMKWTPVPGATRYAVSLYENGKFRVLNANIQDTQYLAGGLTPDKTVRILVQAYAEGRWSRDDLNFLVSARPISSFVPSNSPYLDKTNNRRGDELYLGWAFVEGAERYAISIRDAGMPSTTRTLTTNLTQNEFTISGLTPNKSYEVLLQTYVDGKWSSNTLWHPHTMQVRPPYMDKPVIDFAANGSVGLRWYRTTA